MKTREIVYYDPKNYADSHGQLYLEAALRWLRMEAMDKKGISLTEMYDVVALDAENGGWTLKKAGLDQPQQDKKLDDTECGVLAIVNIDLIAHNIAVVANLYDFRAHDFRTKIGCDLIRGGSAGYPSLSV